MLKTTNQQTLVDLEQRINNFDALVLLSFCIHKPKEFIFAHPEYHLTWREIIHLHYVKGLYLKGWPIAYITHHKEFYGLDFYVNRHTLIPRPDTELLVEEAIVRIKNYELGIKNRSATLIDVGTGSGCIPIAIMRTLNNENLKTKSFAIDISRAALRVAKKNAKQHNVDISFLHGHLLEPIIHDLLFMIHNSIIITANLPYLTEEQFEQEPSIQREPHAALVADKKGLALYEQLLRQINHLISLFPNFPISIILEIDPSQTQPTTSLIRQYLPTASIEVKKDLAGRDRIIIIKIE